MLFVNLPILLCISVVLWFLILVLYVELGESLTSWLKECSKFIDVYKAFADPWLGRSRSTVMWMVNKHELMNVFGCWDISCLLSVGVREQTPNIIPCSDNSVSTSMRESESEVIRWDSAVCALQEFIFDDYNVPFWPSSNKNTFLSGAG